MSSYKSYLIIFTFLISISLNANENKFYIEDQKILFALEYENQKDYKNAKHLYKELYETTNKYEYLLKLTTISFYLKDYTNTLTYSKKLVSLKESLFNYELLATTYLNLKDYENSFKTFDISYKLYDSNSSLRALSNLEYLHLERKDNAKKRLEQYIKKNGYTYMICLQLLSFYEDSNNSNKVLELLENMNDSYEANNRVDLLSKLKEIRIKYLIKYDVDRAISFLEEKYKDDPILLNLYKRVNNLEKAYNFLDRIHKKTNNSDYLAQMAIIQFEMADNKEDVLDSVISKFEKALVNLNDSIYENYLAYILIDYDKDIQKGMSWVKKALAKEPNNGAYIDTLAWGEYKLNNCNEAYNQMKRIEDKSLLEDEEIKLHMEKIKECMK